jgi:hypothetical protein
MLACSVLLRAQNCLYSNFCICFGISCTVHEHTTRLGLLFIAILNRLGHRTHLGRLDRLSTVATPCSRPLVSLILNGLRGGRSEKGTVLAKRRDRPIYIYRNPPSAPGPQTDMHLLRTAGGKAKATEIRFRATSLSNAAGSKCDFGLSRTSQHSR